MKRHSEFALDFTPGTELTARPRIVTPVKIRGLAIARYAGVNQFLCAMRLSPQGTLQCDRLTRLLMNRPLVHSRCLLAGVVFASLRSIGKEGEGQGAQPAVAEKPHNEPPAFDRIAYRTRRWEVVDHIDLARRPRIRRRADGKTQACKYSPQDNTIHFMVGERELVFEDACRANSRLPMERFIWMHRRNPDETARARQQHARLDAAEQQRQEPRNAVLTQWLLNQRKPKATAGRFAVDDGGDGEYGKRSPSPTCRFRARQKTPPAGQTSAGEGVGHLVRGFPSGFRTGMVELAISVLNGRGIHIRFKSQEQCKEVVTAIAPLAFNKCARGSISGEAELSDGVLLHGYTLGEAPARQVRTVGRRMWDA